MDFLSTFVLVLFFVVFIIILLPVKLPVELYHHHSPKNNSLLSQLPSLSHYHCPAWLATSSVIHCIMLLLKKDLKIKYFTEKIKGHDGQILTLDWLKTVDTSEVSTVAVVIPGITGHSNEGYIKHLVKVLNESGNVVVVFNHPGMVETDLLEVPRLFSPHLQDDFETMFNHVKSKYPKASLFAFAYSLGACMMVNYLGKSKENTPVEAAVSISNPFDCHSTHLHMQSSFFSRVIIDRFFASKYKSLYIRNQKILNTKYPHVSLDEVKKVVSIKDWNKLISSKVFGFEDLKAFHDLCSCIASISDVAIPLLVLQALDDPIAPPHSIPFEQLNSNPNIITAVTKVGGHSGWLEGVFPFNRPSWIDRTCVDWLHGIMKTKTKCK